MMKPYYHAIARKSGTCSMYLRFIPSADKKEFKRECARRNVKMIPAHVEFMRRSRELIPMLKIIQGRRDHLDPEVEYTGSHLRPVPETVRSFFKATCAELGVDMVVAHLAFMKQAALILPLLQSKQKRAA